VVIRGQKRGWKDPRRGGEGGGRVSQGLKRLRKGHRRGDVKRHHRSQKKQKKKKARGVMGWGTKGNGVRSKTQKKRAQRGR